ncbi:DMT family transporter [Sedimentimonas flavescens]|uniref:DMT family transporter n=1 Tax=Sedimentimonas flavescens TaxID=2851012 RepID=A0ABT2ZWE4_9RHOB|nr:DMT family transporter [Sedimentimonas flavescens]MCV2878066.1 DMT family transporter [Sedimentimonas flavescens]
MTLLWVWVTLAAAAVQTLRFMLQKRLTGTGLSTGGATFSRFLFGAPIAALAAVLTLAMAGGEVPVPGPRFWAFALAGGAAQVAATFLTVALFKLRNFAVGVAFTKTETVQVAAFSVLVLGEAVTPLGWFGIALGLVGVLLLSRTPRGTAFSARAVVYGVLAGGLFGLSSIGYRGATLELMPAAFITRAIVTLACVTFAQSLGMALYLRLAEPGELGRVIRAWRRTIWVGVTGVAGSAGWFTAFALMNAAYVRALGQVEIVFTLIVSVLVFHERLNPREGAGIALVVASLIAIVLAQSV